jgi:hypothetical protein
MYRVRTLAGVLGTLLAATPVAALTAPTAAEGQAGPERATLMQVRETPTREVGVTRPGGLAWKTSWAPC